MKFYSQFKKYRGLIEERIHRLEPRPVLSAAEFPWTQKVESFHREIQLEARSILERTQDIANFDQVLPGQRALYQGSLWKSFYLTVMGKSVERHQRLCPATTEALGNIPGLLNAFFSILQPGTHIPAHRGPYSGILRYHLGVIVPRGDVAIRIDSQICNWAEGKSLIFDDSFEHEAWNRSESVRVVLFVDIERPLPGFLGLLNHGLLKLMIFSKEVRHAKKTVFQSQLGSGDQKNQKNL